MNFKVLISSVFCILSIYFLILEKNEVIYAAAKEEPFQILYCSRLNETDFFKNKTEIDLAQLGNELFDYLLNDTKIKLSEINFLKNRKSNAFYIFKEYFCLDEIHEEILTKIYKLYDDKPKNYFVLNNDTYDFIKFDRILFITERSSIEDSFLVNQLTILNEDNPNLKCKRNYSRKRCINACSKRKFRLLRYLYTSNEIGKLDLNAKQYNNSIKEHSHHCMENECTEDGCKLVYFKLRQKVPFNIKHIIKSTTFKAELLISNFYFSIQLIGLILFFFGLSCYQIVLKLIKNLLSKFEENENLVRLIKIIILLIFLIVILILFFKLLCDFKDRRDNPLKREITSNLFKIELSDLVVCVHTNNYSPIRNSNKTFQLLEFENEIENLYNDTVEEIYLDFLGKKINVKPVLLKDKVFFYNRIVYNLFRCFQIKVSIEEPTYQSLFLNTKLAIKFRHENYDLYLLPKGNFHTRSYRFNEKMNSFSKKVFNRSKVSKEGCLDYKEVKRNSKCDSRFNCIDQCVHKKSIEKKLNVSANFVVDKSNFDENEWANLFPITIQEDVYFQIKKECEKLLNKSDCNQVFFEDNKNKLFVGRATNLPFGKLEIKIDLYYDVYSSIETESSWYKLILDLLNVQAILFDLNALQLLNILFFFLKFKFNLKGSKFYLSFINAFCLTGFVFHLIFIFNQIINEELVKNQYYEFASFKIPEVVFCFKINQSLIEKEAELTGFISGDKLEDLTNDLRKDTVFHNFTYILPYPNYTDSELNIETFYFLDKKCFNIKTGIEYNKNDPKEVLTIKFNNSFIKKEKDVLFFTKKPGTLHFSKIQVLNYQKWTYSSIQDFFVIEEEDKFHFFKNLFYFIKHPLSIFNENYSNDVDKYLNKLRDDFKRDKNLTTLHLPLDKSNFNIKINDTAFENYYYEKQVQKDQTTVKNPNYERQFTNNLMQIRSAKYSKTKDFIYGVAFFKKRIVITNEDNFIKPILNILNVLSLWLSLNLFQTFIFKLKLLFNSDN